MRKQFEWYLKPSTEEINEIWKNGVLSVDANVLLDLYRYNEKTRNSLVEALTKFKGGKWITFQACTEFFRNRNKVIVSSEKTFKEALDEIQKLAKSLDATTSQLKGNRLLSAEISENLQKEITPIIDSTYKKIELSKTQYPNFLQNDSILESIVKLFDNSVGKPFDNDTYENEVKIAEERKNKKIPPGYLDDDKEDEKPYGDYFVWRQLLNYSKGTKKSIIFVTSERKDDWWEKISNKTIGPRPELLKEAYEVTGKRIMIYQTDVFLEHAAKQLGETVDSEVVEEIRTVSNLRYDYMNSVQLVSQQVLINNEKENHGRIIFRIIRDMYKFTGSGHFNPILESIPSLSVTLIGSPDRIPQCTIKCGTGTNYDFNIHVKTLEYNVPLPSGEYVFEYHAKGNIKCENDSSEGILNE